MVIKGEHPSIVKKESSSNLCNEVAGIRGFPQASGLPQWLSGKESAYSAGVARDVDSIPGLGRSHGGEHGNPLQYSCLENPMDRGVWWATVHGVTKSQTRLSDLACTIRPNDRI